MGHGGLTHGHSVYPDNGHESRGHQGHKGQGYEGHGGQGRHMGSGGHGGLTGSEHGGHTRHGGHGSYSSTLQVHTHGQAHHESSIGGFRPPSSRHSTSPNSISLPYLRSREIKEELHSEERGESELRVKSGSADLRHISQPSSSSRSFSPSTPPVYSPLRVTGNLLPPSGPIIGIPLDVDELEGETQGGSGGILDQGEEEEGLRRVKRRESTTRGGGDPDSDSEEKRLQTKQWMNQAKGTSSFFSSSASSADTPALCLVYSTCLAS